MMTGAHDNRQTGLLLGAHMSMIGGVWTAVERAALIGCTTFQMFVKNNNQWRGKPLAEDEIITYKELRSKARIGPVIAHSTYLINLCAIEPRLLKKSREAFQDELNRCAQLNIDGLNVHPGAHRGAGESEGIKRIAESLNISHERTPGIHVKTILETTAGQGTSVGHRFEQLRMIIDLVEEKDRMGVCIDTCHVFAAGYDLGTDKGYERTFNEFRDVIGFQRLAAFHMNDSKRECGSHIDRHEHIGKGMIGTRGFSLLMNDERFRRVPKILETPKGPEMAEDIENMNVLKNLMRKP